MGRGHLAALRRSPLIALAAVVDPVLSVRQELAAAGLSTYATVAELLAHEPPEAVLIAAPSDQHSDLVAGLAQAGVAVLCEKPLGFTTADAREAARYAREAAVPLQVGYWRRFVPELCDLRRRIGAGDLGQIILLSCLQWDARLPTEEFRARSGGIAVDMGVHEFDQARWLLGQEFDWVAATAAGPSSATRERADPDSTAILAGLSDGAAATISLGRRFAHADCCWLEVWGTEGYERIPFIWGSAGEQVFHTAVLRQLEAFARRVRGAAAPPVADSEPAGAEEAVAALAVAAAAAESLAAGGRQVSCASAVVA
jgi:myo-inositol 2-dehydrogenase/D-chiro-inositol 1-dehydrogenase